MFKIASWNVNSLKVRLEQVLAWLGSSQVDVLGLQETKLIDENFPISAFIELGYHVTCSGQKNYNGVALISRNPIDEVITDIPGYDDPQRRILAATIQGIRVINLYVPNGSEPESDKYYYKLTWLAEVTHFIAGQLKVYDKVAVMGDFNIAPEDRDVHDPLAWEGAILVSEPERNAFRCLLDLGLYDSFRAFVQEDRLFSWWDYRAGAFRRNHGLRIDHVLLNEALNSCCRSSAIDKIPRTSERPSDHAPVWVELEL